MKVFVKEKWLKIGIFVFILSGYVYLTNGKTMEQIALVVSFLIYLAGTTGISRRNTKFSIEEKLNLLFVLSFMVCSISNFSLTPLVYGAAMFLSFFLCNNIIKNCCNMEIYKYIQQCVMTISWPIIFLSIINHPIAMQNYRGIFGNSNGMGAFAAVLFTVSLSWIIKNNESTTFIKLVYIVSLLCSLFLALISTSRSAFMVIGVEIAVTVLLEFKNYMYNNKIGLTIFIKQMIVMLLVAVLLSVIVKSEAFTNMIGKITHLSADGDITNARGARWELISQYSQLFGDGQDVVNTVSHNIYYGLMNGFGKIPAVIYLLFCICYSFKIFIYTYKHSEEKNYLYIFSAVCFMIYSMVENFLMTPAMLLFYLSIVYDKEDINLSEHTNAEGKINE